jgi:hypothetical protein
MQHLSLTSSKQTKGAPTYCPILVKVIARTYFSGSIAFELCSLTALRYAWADMLEL